MPRLNDHDRQNLRRVASLEAAEARHDGRCGVRISLQGHDVAMATTAMAQALSVAEQAEAARRLAALWTLMRNVPTDVLEQKAREMAASK